MTLVQEYTMTLVQEYRSTPMTLVHRYSTPMTLVQE